MGKEIFSRTQLLLGAQAADSLTACRVILFGVGGVGSWCAESLVRSGVGHLTIVDHDTICPSNINRQLPATTKTVGRPKVEVLRERLLEINPDADICARQETFSADTAERFALGEYDYIVDAIDSLADKCHLIVSACQQRGTLFSSMGAALKMDPTAIRVAEFWRVQGCPLARAIRNRFKREKVFPQKKFRCVYSPELLPNKGEQEADAGSGTRRANGTICHATAIFGFTLAGLVIQNYYSRVSNAAAGGR